jgi:hypothetical protein
LHPELFNPSLIQKIFENLFRRLFDIQDYHQIIYMSVAISLS